MNFCPNCGAKRTMNANFCSNCGSALNSRSSNQITNNNCAGNDFNNNSLLGTMVTVQLINGLTKNLYEKNGNYYTDKACRHQFNPAMIMSVMGSDIDDTIDAMTLTGNRISMETIHKNQMAKMQMNAFRRKKE